MNLAPVELEPTCHACELRPLDAPRASFLLAPAPIDAIAPGSSILGKYVVQGVLGYGGFAVVYDAEHVGLGRRVAIKVLHLRPDTPLALVERFRREARISALVRHRNVLEAYDTGTLSDGSPYLVMERINGQNLAVFLQDGPLPIATAVEIARQLLQGLAAIADAGIVHRDIKPENVMLHDPGEGSRVVKLVDFGVAKRVAIEPATRLTCQGALVGTPQYMAPEQIRGEELDVRADLYATGAVLYEMLSGHAPHETTNFCELVGAVLNEPIERLRRHRPNCPAELDNVVLKALSRARTRRYGSPRDFLAALEKVADVYALARGEAAFVLREAGEEPRCEPARRSGTWIRLAWPPASPPTRVLQLTLVALLAGSSGSSSNVSAGSKRIDTVAATAQPERARAAAPAHANARVVPVVVPLPVSGALDAAGSPFEASRAAAAGSHAGSREERAADEGRGFREGSEPGAAQDGRGALRASPDHRSDGDHASGSDGSGGDLENGAAESAELEAAAGARGAQEALPTRAPADPSSATPQPAPGKLGALPPEPSPRRLWEDLMREAFAALVRGDLDGAKQRYQEAVRVDPHEASGFRGLGLVSARLGDHAQARAAFARYLELAPSAPDAQVIAARVAALPH